MIPKKEGTFTIQHDGKDYSGFYCVEKDMITVNSAYGDKTAHLGSMPPQTLARMLLREIIIEKLKK